MSEDVTVAVVSNIDTVERCALNPEAVASEEGPPVKKARMQMSLQSSSRSVGQRIKESTLKDPLQTSKSSACRSPNVDRNSHSTPLPPRCLTQVQINTIRIIGQYLKNLGLQETVATLFTESGCRLEDSLAVRLRECILNGDWDLSLHLLNKMSSFVPRANLEQIRCKFLEEKYVELLVNDKAVEALRLLTVDFPADMALVEHRNFLATLLYVDPKVSDLYERTGTHKTRQDRINLVVEVQQLLPTSVMLPPNRLEQLLKQAWKTQSQDCYLHLSEPRLTPDFVLENHQCGWKDFPLCPVQVLNNYQDEVWCASFSPCGKYLATGAKSGPTLVWKVNQQCLLEPYKSFEGHQNIAVLSWSEDSAMLAVAAADVLETDIFVYDVHNGSVFCTVDNRSSDTTVLAFSPGCQTYHLVCGDQKGRFCQYALSQDANKIVGKFDGYRIRALYCCKDGSVLAADTHNRVRKYCFNTETEENFITEQSQIITFTVDRQERYLLVDAKLHGLRLWDLKSGTLLRTYSDAAHQDLIVHSSFGGNNQNYIATGCNEDVRIWNHKSDHLIASLSGHTGKVNTVVWNPTNPRMLVSCSDDNTVRVWASSTLS
uniref:LisH domain-containing protein n=1 Tax=Syphacia muris TaxID=451379 RepID=A0A0N5AHY7_9BILA